MWRIYFCLLGVFCFGLGSPALGQVRVLCLGDSLTEGYMLSKDQAWPALVETALQQKGYKVTLVNAGISGSTTASGASRLQWHLKGKEPAQILILALGANDGLRGLDVAAAKKNLIATIRLAKQAKMGVLLAGMRIPPNYGAGYTETFHKIFAEIATEEHIPLVPFMLEGVGGEPSLNLPDGIHPNAKGYKVVAETMLRALEPLLKEQPR